MAYLDFLSLYSAQFPVIITRSRQVMLRIVILILQIVLAILVYIASRLK